MWGYSDFIIWVMSLASLHRFTRFILYSIKKRVREMNQVNMSNPYLFLILPLTTQSSFYYFYNFML